MEAGDHAFGRSRGGLSTKVHLACDGRGRPLGFVLSGGNVNDCTRLEQVMDSVSVPRVGPGRPRTPARPCGRRQGLLLSRKIRTYLRRRGKEFRRLPLRRAVTQSPLHRLDHRLVGPRGGFSQLR
ncbi:transposase [Streptomyces sp. IBSBF 2807]|nr:transposase [Streptomyces hilarionis]